jgi:hypothetical protein
LQLRYGLENLSVYGGMVADHFVDNLWVAARAQYIRVLLMEANSQVNAFLPLDAPFLK